MGVTAVWLVLTVHTQAASPAAQAGAEPVVAIVGSTLIDGNGGAPVANATIVMKGNRIVALGPKATVTVPAGAQIIDGTGKFTMPGIIDTNVHVGPISGETTFARYWDRMDDVVLQAAQLHLKHGVTTVRDSYGPLTPLKSVRDAIAKGTAVGPRMLVAGNIVGWGGPFTTTFNRREHDQTSNFFEEQVNDQFTQGSGEEMLHMSADELRVAINKYLDHGPDFIKYGGTEHNEYPILIGFSERAQKVLVDETHKRGLMIETHSTTLEGLHMSIMAGLDIIQHPEVLGFREITDELLDLIVGRKIICSMLPNKYTGKLWLDDQKERAKKKTPPAEGEEQGSKPPSRLIPKTGAELRRQVVETGAIQKDEMLIPNLEMRRMNARKLIARGAIISVGADNVVGEAPEFRRTRKPDHLEPGLGTIAAIEGLVEMGMTPAQAVVAATKHGAMAAKALDKIGTLEVGKMADVLLLTADPTVNISNIRKLEAVIRDGRVIDLKSLPTKRPFGAWSTAE